MSNNGNSHIEIVCDYILDSEAEDFITQVVESSDFSEEEQELLVAYANNTLDEEKNEEVFRLLADFNHVYAHAVLVKQGK